MISRRTGLTGCPSETKAGCGGARADEAGWATKYKTIGDLTTAEKLQDFGISSREPHVIAKGERLNGKEQLVRSGFL